MVNAVKEKGNEYTETLTFKANFAVKSCLTQLIKMCSPYYRDLSRNKITALTSNLFEKVGKLVTL